MKARPPKISDRDPSTLTNGAINAEVTRLDKASSDVNAAMIEAGYGNLRPSDIYADPKLLHVPVIGWHRKITDRLQKLHYEKEQRMGSRWPGQLPRGKARIPTKRTQIKSAAAVGGLVEVLADDQESADAIAAHIESEIRKGKLGKNPMPRKKKRKATPAQLRALAKGRATAARNRKKKAPKRKKVARRSNPAYGNYSKARQIARGTRRPNPVRKLAPVYAIESSGKYFNGVRFSGTAETAARFKTLKHASRVAHILADDYKKSVRIVDLRK